MNARISIIHLVRPSLALSALLGSLCTPVIGMAQSSEPAQTGPENGAEPAAYTQTLALDEVKKFSSTEVDTNASVGLATITVVGERIDRTLMETDNSIRVIDREDIEMGAMDDLYDALLRTANVNANNANAGDRGSFSIRGIADTGVAIGSFGSNTPLATILVDGVALIGVGSRAGPLDFWDVDSVEFLRGPQSTNQGKNALAGAILINTRAPTPVLDLRMRMRRGNLDGEQDAVALSGPIWGPFSGRFAAQRDAFTGPDFNVTRNEPARFRERDNLRGKLQFAPEALPDLTATLTLTRGTEFFGQPQLSGDPRAREAEANDPQEAQAETDLAALNLNYVINDSWSLTAITGLAESALEQLDDYNASAAEDGTIATFLEDQTLSQEIRANFSGLRLFNRSLRGVVGIYTAEFGRQSDQRVRDGNVTGGVPFDAFINGDTVVDDEQTNIALFAEADYSLLPLWTLNLGLRHDREEALFEYSSDFQLSPFVSDPGPIGDLIGTLVGPSLGLPADGEGSEEVSASVWLPKIGIRHDFADQWSLGLQWQRAYRSGGLSVNFARAEFQTFDPEFTSTYELSLRGMAWDQRLRLRANVFYTDWQDQQVSVQLSEDVNDTQTENAGASTLYGGEIEMELQLTRRWQGFMSAGYSRTRFDDFDSSAGDFSGNEFPSAPRRQGALGVSYRQNTGLYGQLTLNYVDASFRQADNAPDQRSDSFALLNGRIGWRHQGWEVFLAGRNLLDRFYLTQRAFGFFMVGEPRTVFAGMELDLSRRR